jgi:hypothetical protein
MIVKKVRNSLTMNDIGTAWYGRHVVIITCNPNTNTVLDIKHSTSAPTEPIQSSCTKTLAMYFSIGYALSGVTAIGPNAIQYVFVK